MAVCRLRTDSERREDTKPPITGLRWPISLFWWLYLFLAAFSPLLVLAEEDVVLDENGYLPNGCLWDDLQLELNCSSLGLTSVPHVPSSISGQVKQLNLVNNNLQIITIEDFKNFSRLTLLDLRSNNIQEIHDEVFSFRLLPTLQRLFLARNRLVDLPPNVFQFSGFTTLDLSHNLFKEPPPALGNTNQISHLLLNNNPLRGLHKDSLANISSLETLELSACNLTNDNLAPEVFRDLKSVRTLYLDLNHFNIIKRQMFAFMSSPSYLYLQQCGIESIEKKAFKQLKNLNGLYLAHNHIVELEPNVFHELNMKDLDLRHCGIQNIRRGAFRTRIANKLFLSYNNISVIHKRDFYSLRAVRYLDLSHSNIAEIRGSPFYELDALQELQLQYNVLVDEGITSDSFRTSGRLDDLDLTGNRLNSIPDLNGTSFPHLHQLNIGGNRISRITNSQLRNMSSLSVLILKENPIEEIENEAFMECWHVSDLNLDSTRMKHLPNMSSMRQLSDLHIVHGKLEEFPEDLCTTCPRLIIIEAPDNNIKKFANFSRCHNLFSLALDYNDITEIPAGVLDGLTKLDVLKLHQNKIKFIAPDVFKDLRILKSLTLNHNKVELLHFELFSKLTALRTLNLGFNRVYSLPERLFVNNTLLTKLWLNNNNIHNVHVTAFGQMPYLQVLNLSSNYFCYLEIPGTGFPSLRVLNLEQLWCLHNVPNPHTMPNVQEVHYTYAYHCCLWEDTLDLEVYKNDTVVSTTVPPEATGEITLPPHVIPLLPEDPFENDDCTSPTASPDRNTIITDFAGVFNMSVEFGPGCSFEIMSPSSIGLSPEDILNFQNGQSTSFLDENFIIIGTDTEDFFDGVNNLRSHYVAPPTAAPFTAVKCYPRPNPLTPCDNLLDPWPIRIAIWAVWVLTLLGNIAILFIMIAARQRMDVSQSFICVLAFSNTILGIYLAFIAMVDIRTLGDRNFYQSALEWQKGSGCQTAGFLAIFSSQLSVYILVVLTVERLRHTISSITSPYPKEEKRLHIAMGIIVVGVLYASTLAVLPLKGMGVNAYDEVAVCLPFVTKTLGDRRYILTILTMNLLAILVVVLAFLVAFSFLFRTSFSWKQRWSLIKGIVKLTLLMITTFMCWFPLGLVGYSSVIRSPMIDAGQSKYFIVFVLPINALFSPIIYALITRSFQRNIWWIVTCCPNTKKKNTSSQAFRLIQRQATSTPSSLISDIPRGLSPGCLTGDELRALRQSRRSNSYSVQFNPNIQHQLCPTPPMPGSITRMGRRASLPAVFESNVSSCEREETFEQNSPLPLRFAPGLLSKLDSSLPNLPEENEEQDVPVPVPVPVPVESSKSASDTQSKKCESVEQKCETECLEPVASLPLNAETCLESYNHDGNEAHISGNDRDVSNSPVTLDEDNTQENTCPSESPSVNHNEEIKFNYTRLNEQTSRRLEIVNPRFSLSSPTQASETDV